MVLLRRHPGDHRSGQQGRRLERPRARLLVAFLVVGIGLSLGGPTGYAINPARDLGPRIMHAILPIPGKGPSDWGYAWIPVVGPLIGGVIGAPDLRRLRLARARSAHEEAHQRPRGRPPGRPRGDGRRARRPRPRHLSTRRSSCGPTRPSRARSAIISGGGSGHEPMHGGFVGTGMLDAACPGEVFTSPTPDQMDAATKAVNGGAGVLHIVKNYTGDVMNFEMAAEIAAGEDIEVVVGRDERRRRGAGQPLHGRPARRRRDRARGEDLRRGGRGGQVAAGGRRHLPARQRPGPQHGHGAHAVHHAGRGRAELHARRRRDGDRHRHPRRAGPRSA